MRKLFIKLKQLFCAALKELAAVFRDQYNPYHPRDEDMEPAPSVALPEKPLNNELARVPQTEPLIDQPLGTDHRRRNTETVESRERGRPRNNDKGLVPIVTLSDKPLIDVLTSNPQTRPLVDQLREAVHCRRHAGTAESRERGRPRNFRQTKNIGLDSELVFLIEIARCTGQYSGSISSLINDAMYSYFVINYHNIHEVLLLIQSEPASNKKNDNEQNII